MLNIILNILSIIGMLLLIVLCIVLFLLILVLFYPITYRIFGVKNADDIMARLKVNWLFGLFRVRFTYPDPGNITVKLLWITLYDSASPKKENAEADNPPKADSKKEAQPKDAIPHSSPAAEKNIADTEAQTKEISHENTESAPENKTSLLERILLKCEKIKYTILKIYAKIKHIVENITFYKDLLQDEETIGLLKHTGFRLGRIWKNIRPRKLKGHILFGTGSPDTTGYAFGVYGMISPQLGKHINITPDFTQAVLEGEVYAAGHITLFQVGMHTIILLLDKRLKQLIDKIKKHNKQDNQNI